MTYEKINWENQPSKKTPINATNLNYMDDGIYEAHERINANSIISTAQGETILVTDSAKVPPENIKLFGKTTQVTTEGNQLFDGTVINAIGSTNGTLISSTLKSAIIPITGGQTYTISVMTKDVIFTSTTSEYPAVNVALVDAYSGTSGNSVSSKTVVTSANANYLVVGFGNGVDIHTGEIMVNIGTTALPLEPYTGKKPSPSIEYPQEFNSCGDDGSINNALLGANFFKPNVNTVNCTYNNNGTYNIDNGKGVFCINADQSSIPMQEINIQNGNVTLSFTITAQTAYTLESVFLCTMGSSTKNYGFVVNKTIAWSTLKMTHNFTFDNNVEKIGLVFYGNTTNNLQIKDISLVVGTEDKGYEPYTEQTLTTITPNGLKGIPLGQTIPDSIKNSPIHMSGVYHDGEQYWIGDTIDFESGKHIKRVDKLGIESFDIVRISNDNNWYDSEKSYSYECVTIGDLAFETMSAREMCTHLVGYTFSSFYNKSIENGFTVGMPYIVCNISKTYGICTTVEEFKQWCISNDVKFVKILSSPIETDLTTEELAQYNALCMNYPNTTITNDSEAYTEVEYVASPKEYIANLEKKHDNDIQQLKTAIIALGGTI